MASIPLPPNWSNWIEDYGANADRYVANSQQDLIDFVNRAVTSGRRIRAVGAGHSMSKCARPRDSFVVLGEELSGAFPEVKWLKRNPPGLAAGERLIRVKAGTRLKTLNRIILPSQNPPAALINMGAFDGQTISGAISTGTHGSGVTLGGLADAVVSLDMVCVTKSSDGTPHVQLHRFEPANGVTERAAFDADKLQHGMVLEQNDDTFNSVVVSYGCIGIVFAYTLKVRDTYWLREDTTLMDWPALRAALAAPIASFVPGAGKNIPKFITED